MTQPKDRVPPGQTVVTDFPVLHFGGVPRIKLENYRFRIFGLVEEEQTWTYEQLMELPKITVQNDIHCVTGWSKLDNTWEGIPFAEVYKRSKALPEAKYVMVHAPGDWSTNLPLEDCLKEGVLFATKHNGADLDPDHGWPLRLVVPHLYFWKSAKWVTGIEFMKHNWPGFWESNGYHIYGDPWKEQRYTND